MKFRFKVLIINIILLSIGISTIGYFMIDKNVNMALQEQVRNAIDENNMLQAAIEYQLLNYAASSSSLIAQQLPDITKDVISGMSASQSHIYILFNDSIAFSSEEHYQDPVNLFKINTEMGKKKYAIHAENGKYYVYTASCNVLADSNLNIINKRDITDSYTLMQEEIQYFRFLLVLILVFCSIGMTIICTILTKPLEHLRAVSDSFGKGDYTARATVYSSDEVGILANTYNEMAESVEEHVKDLEDMVERQDQFVADFSHEMKTPMTAIIGYADMLRSQELTKENQITASSYIFNEGRRLETMSQKLFDLIYTKQNRIVKTDFFTKQLMTQVAESVTPGLNAKNITLDFSYDNVKLNGDIDLLKSSFINLIDNARKASPEGKTIRFTGRTSDSGYLITVQDFGIGIDEKHLSRITDAFYMVDKSRSRTEGGAGLGLSLASMIFSKHDANLSIKSKLNEGTTITVTFPYEANTTTVDEDNHI